MVLAHRHALSMSLKLLRQGGNVGVLHRCWLYELLMQEPLCCEVHSVTDKTCEIGQ